MVKMWIWLDLLLIMVLGKVVLFGGIFVMGGVVRMEVFVLIGGICICVSVCFDLVGRIVSKLCFIFSFLVVRVLCFGVI